MNFQNVIHRVHKVPAHVRLWISIAFALIIFLLAGRTPTAIQLILAWSGFTFAILVLVWTTILTAGPHEVKLIAKMQDSSRTITFAFVIFASFISLFAVIFLLRILSDTKQAGYAYHVGFLILSVILSWNMIHTIFAIRYTHLYYNLLAEEKDSDKEHKGGLIFPANDPPDYLDLVYFSYVIGMTFQVSDIQITSRRIRHLVLFHAVLSFAYNTVILALCITIISALIQK
jgi:uncharacterized membrane protein